MIHDGECLANDPVVNGAACHTVHHYTSTTTTVNSLPMGLGGTYENVGIIQQVFEKSIRPRKRQIAKWKYQNLFEGDDDDNLHY